MHPLEAKYRQEIERIRADLSALELYRYDENIPGGRQSERLRLAIVLYNGVRVPEDYVIVKFLFDEEVKYRKVIHDHGDADVLYLLALILVRFGDPSVVWDFWAAKRIDFDIGIGFDGEYLLVGDIDRMYSYLASVEHPYKQSVLDYITDPSGQCNFTPADLERWLQGKRIYFAIFDFPLDASLEFLRIVNERELFAENLADWLAGPRDWKGEDAENFSYYAEYLDDRNLKMQAYLLCLEKGGPGYSMDSYGVKLGKLYIETGAFDKAREILSRTRSSTETRYIINECNELIGRIRNS